MSSATPRLILDLVDILKQGRDLIAASSDTLYQQLPDQFKASSLGAHYRHHLEHVELLLSGLGQSVIDYDDRARNQQLETDRAYALERTDALIDAFLGLQEDALNEELTVVYRSCTEADTRPRAKSTLGREMLFLISHAVHHYALMRILVEASGASTRDDFGVMPSTQAHPEAKKHVFGR